jgi:1,6-anhydro-N-acetylmuramate kinase
MMNPSGDIQLGQTEGLEEAERGKRAKQQRRQERAQRRQLREQQQQQQQQQQQFHHHHHHQQPQQFHQQQFHGQQPFHGGPGAYPAPYPRGASPGVVIVSYGGMRPANVYGPGYGAPPVPVLVSHEDMAQYALAAHEVKRKHMRWFTLFMVLAVGALVMALFSEGGVKFAFWCVSIACTFAGLGTSVSMRQKIRRIQMMAIRGEPLPRTGAVTEVEPV